MSVKAMSVVWDTELPRDEKIVLLALADHAHDDGSSVRPSVSTVARKCGYSPRSIQRKFMQLRERGLLEIIEEEPGRPVEYRINLEGCAKLSPLTPSVVPTPDTGVVPTPDIAVSPKPSEQPSEQPSLSLDPEPDPVVSLRSDFDDLWLVAPGRGSKKLAWAEYRKVVPHKATAMEILEAREAHVDAASEPKFVKHLERWLRDERWLDVRTETSRKTASARSGNGVFY